MSEMPDNLQRHINQIMNEMLNALYPPVGMQPVTVTWSDAQDPGSWTLPPEPEWQYVEDFAGHKLYRRVWPDTPSMHGREEWSASLPASKATLMPGGMCGYGSTGSRMELRRAILRNRDMPARRAADGGLVGWRYWTINDQRLYGEGHTYTVGSSFNRWDDPILRSPQRGTIWDGPTLSAIEWSDVAACEGHAGIHALLRPQVIRGHYLSGHPITGRVRGYGRYVLGTRGWRAERVVIDYLRVPADIFEQVKGPLSERYQCEVRRQYR